ncbi:MAG: murein L,D-transpeptidase catalytic domain-containing protein, partial [Bdellovibrionota bacterium]
MKLLPALLLPLLVSPAFAGTEGPNLDSIVSEQIAKQYEKLGGSPKALKHLSCILKSQRNTRFGLKEVKDKYNYDLINKCNKVEDGKPEISIHRDDYALVIDYTLPPTSRRMFLIPVKGKGNVEAYYAGHGRFGETPRNNTKASAEGNSITSLKLFSNKPDNNGTATGLYIAGNDYFGKYNGPKREVTKTTKRTVTGKDGKKHTVVSSYTYTEKADPKHPTYSLVLQGVETDVNDNACTRATVIHGTTKISESGKDAGVHLMSSGCPMVSYQAV